MDISLKDYVRNRARPEGSIAEGYIVDEALTFCSMYFQRIETKFNRSDRNEDAIDTGPQKQLSVFQSQCRPTGKKTYVSLDTHLRKKAEWYILNNCPEIQNYLE